MTLQTWNDVDDPIAGEGVSATDYGIPVLENLDRLHALEDQVFYVPLNGATPLVTGDKQYWPVPKKFHLGSLVEVGAKCKVGSTSGDVSLDVKIGATSLLSTTITLDQNETDTNTAATPPVVNSGVNTLHNDGTSAADFVEISVISAGASVTYCGVELTVRPAA